MIKIIKKKTKFIAKIKNKKIGELIFGYPDDESKKRNITIYWFEVLKEYRKKGVGTLLLKEFIKYSKERFYWLYLWTGKDIEKSKNSSYYENFGFKKYVYLEDYYEENVGVTFYALKLDNG
jgi:phosphinothricin acetyltransferase